MNDPVWTRALKESADPARARQHLDLLRSGVAGEPITAGDVSPDEARIWAAVLAGSKALTELLAKHPAWLKSCLDPEMLQRPRRSEGLKREVGEWLPSLIRAKDYGEALRRLREFHQREMVRIAARDLARLGLMSEVTVELSNVADVCLDAVAAVVFDRMTGRMGRPYHQDPAGGWRPTPFCVLGMGKLGGQELNYSSDVDVLFVYEEEGVVFTTAPKRSEAAPEGAVSSHQFFERFAEAFVAEVSQMTPAGALYRIDLRLRPEGQTGPLTRSLPSYENYYAQWGQTWERMMLIKARCVAGDAILGGEFVEMIQPFRYPRSLGRGALNEVRAMKQRIENEVVRAGEIDRNVKLGRGGIREIEFVVQAMQLLHAGRIPFLQIPRTLPALEKLVHYDLLDSGDARVLSEAYIFLRDLEHRLQMENNLQTHTIPTMRSARERLAHLMGYSSLRRFESAKTEHCNRVRALYDRLFKPSGRDRKSPLPNDLDHDSEAWLNELSMRGFRDPVQAFALIKKFVRGPGYGHVSSRTSELGLALLERLLSFCPDRSKAGAARRSPKGNRALRKQGGDGDAGAVDPRLSDPDRVLARLDSFVGVYGARATLFETWHSNPGLFQLMALLFDRSEFLAESAIRTPDLVDELQLSGRLRRRKTAAETLEDLRHGRKDKDQHLWLRRYHQAEFMRIGLRDILGFAGFEQNLEELTALADACLQYALEAVCARHRINAPPFAVLGLGKLGGCELNYGSDLDILFVAPDGVKRLDRLAGFASEMMDLLSRKTADGMLFETDARLRPDGESGLLVNTLGAFEDYYRKRAQLWEIQSLTRLRHIAGDRSAGSGLTSLAEKLTDFSRPNLPLAAFGPEWVETIAAMRERIASERTQPGLGRLAIKTGEGGLMDAEFVAQILVLSHGWTEPNTLRVLERGRKSGALPAGPADRLIRAYQQLRQIEGILRRWSYAAETALPEDPKALFRVAVRCGFESAESFQAHVDGCRATIRSVYTSVIRARARANASGANVRGRGSSGEGRAPTRRARVKKK